MWDPQGKYLTGGSSESNSGAGKVYRHAGTDLVTRFADQFAVWSFQSNDVAHPIAATLLRLPLRTKEQAHCSTLCNVRMSYHTLSLGLAPTLPYIRCHTSFGHITCSLLHHSGCLMLHLLSCCMSSEGDTGLAIDILDSCGC